MRLNGLGACLACSVVLNLAGFGPLMGFLLNRPTQDRPAPPPPLQVRLAAPPPVARVETRPQPPIERPRPQLIKQPLAVRQQEVRVTAPPPQAPRALAIPKDSVPQAKSVPSAKPRGGPPPRTLTRPDVDASHRQNESAPGPAQPPGDPNGGEPMVPENSPSPEPAPAAATPAPEPTPDPGPLASQPQPGTPSPAATPSPEPTSAVIPDKPAMPRSNPPNSNSRAVLRRVGGKSFIRLSLKVFPDGHIEPTVLVSSGLPELDQAVLTDLRDWRWEPAEVAGKPVLSEKPIKLKLEAD